MPAKVKGLEVVEYVMNSYLGELNKGVIFSNNELPSFLDETLKGKYAVNEEVYNKLLKLLKDTNNTLL